MTQWPDAATALPDDGTEGVLVGRVWQPGTGPCVVAVRESGVHDVTGTFPTVRDLCETPDPAAQLRTADGECLAGLDELLANTPPGTRDPARPWLLAPVDLQAVKAAGVTFVVSMLERVIEERLRGEASGAAEVRERIRGLVGDDPASLRPGSAEAGALKELLVARGMWSQYLEVGIGPDAEIFTKAPVLAAVGTATDAGVLRTSRWNNPEPEMVMVVSSAGKVVGATLGNDINLRDVEGRSALLLSKAKDNNASAVLGPFVRLFDETFGMDDVRNAAVTLTVEGEEGYRLDAVSSMSAISRDPLDLVGQLIGPHHQYPDGAVLYLGTMFAPVEDRDTPGQGFTHHDGDLVTIATPRLGSLVSRIRPSDACEPWNFGISDLMRSLAARGAL
ncbi:MULTISPECIES: fumarylacetoacetate hydrolase family protein [Streptomyces]|uniref:Fumarylacetoacetate hydrolase family protein n=1 Tax=Streptomyces glycanivorans TaxID=3033808 RepID=A0ABY9J797_9ACTN|nr:MULTISPECIES: fumarylacetoacetate hydrolase family protein [unclassified Streptomyces]WSQ75654.1 fumarylacetoacetate hydrolase family protein [Streptomyces sp. NBC_01213]TXS12815.1 fumarylacetoacetate hydrolase [Streptomyces sp. wa22]WLQ62143.1 fumarylacetoacetate hydrolase family protein [Streptomyces sp. Alt3]WSQ82900.1 fumarylacetoacetate hydrolase family protein [Streptomyces sp. NBC_01212]WSR04578.1 fumarylacetoacetate hydrolase family protein [Streptomyces sp. NBC_01208]